MFEALKLELRLNVNMYKMSQDEQTKKSAYFIDFKVFFVSLFFVPKLKKNGYISEPNNVLVYW